MGNRYLAHSSYEFRLLPAIEQLGTTAELRRTACVLRLSGARHRNSALQASSSLRRVSGVALLFLRAWLRKHTSGFRLLGHFNRLAADYPRGSGWTQRYQPLLSSTALRVVAVRKRRSGGRSLRSHTLGWAVA